MLSPRYVVFTAVEGVLLDSASRVVEAAGDALDQLAPRNTPVVLASSWPRAQLEPVRRKLEHIHPFLTESGGGLFLPDGYFSIPIEGAVRKGRFFCVPFGQDYAACVAALEEIAAEADASAVGYSQMSAREIANDTGLSPREAELARAREFSERFFLAGSSEEAAKRLAETARKRGWQATPGQPFWELSSGNDVGRGVRTLMRFYRSSLRVRLSSIGVGNAAEHLPLLSAVDHPIVLPRSGHLFDEMLASRLPHAKRGEARGAAAWSEAVFRFVEAKS